MKKATALILTAVFVLLGVFGLFSMNHESMQKHISCVASMVQGTVCPDRTDVFNFIAFHVEAFKAFSQAVFSQDVLGLALALSIIIFLAAAFVADSTYVVLLFGNACQGFQQLLKPSLCPIKQKTFSWLAFKEHSPTAF